MTELTVNENKDAFLVVDIQNDFCPGGALAVPNGDIVIPIINRLMDLFKVVVFTRDWHPPDHISFSKTPEFVDKSWPKHCVANENGSNFHPSLKIHPDAIIVNKATEQDKEAYSGFDGTPLHRILSECGINRILLAGMATDYCVKNTALDGLKSGYDVYVIEDAIQGVDIPEGNVIRAMNDMKIAGVKFILSSAIHAD